MNFHLFADGQLVMDREAWEASGGGQVVAARMETDDKLQVSVSSVTVSHLTPEKSALTRAGLEVLGITRPSGITARVEGTGAITVTDSRREHRPTARETWMTAESHLTPVTEDDHRVGKRNSPSFGPSTEAWAVIYRPHNRMLMETQYHGPFFSQVDAYDYMCALPAPGPHIPEGVTPNPGVKFIQPLISTSPKP